MGGPGSGQLVAGGIQRQQRKVQHRIDVRWLKKQGLLKPGNMGLISWSRGVKKQALLVSEWKQTI